MPLRFDATIKDLVQSHVPDFEEQLELTDLGPLRPLYNSLLHHRFRVPVHSMIVLLRPSADDAQLTGRLRYQARQRRGKMDFAYEVVRLWEWPAERLLRGGLGTLPLALLGKLPAKSVESAVADVLQRIAERLAREASAAGTAKLLTASYVLSGLRVPKDVADRLFKECEP